MKAKTVAVCLGLLCACLLGALCSELAAGKKADTFVEATKPTNVIRTSQLCIVDEKGRTRMLLEPDGLTLRDAKGRVLGLMPLGIVVVDDKGIIRTVVGPGMLAVRDRQGMKRFEVHTAHPTVTSMCFWGPKGAFHGQIASSGAGAFLQTGSAKTLRTVRLADLGKPFGSVIPKPPPKPGARPTWPKTFHRSTSRPR